MLYEIADDSNLVFERGRETGPSTLRWPALRACHWGGCAVIPMSRAKRESSKRIETDAPAGAAAHPPHYQLHLAKLISTNLKGDNMKDTTKLVTKLLIALAILLGLFILVKSILVFNVTPTPIAKYDAAGGIPPLILDNLRRWELIANSLRALQVILGVVGTVAALVATTFTAELGTFRVKICTAIAAFCIGMIAAFDIGGKANQTRNAWRELTVAILKYENAHPPTAQDYENLLSAYRHGEERVGDVTFQPASNQIPPVQQHGQRDK
jgi:hypothetical protein